MLFEGEQPAKIVVNMENKVPGRMARHSVEFLSEVGLVVVVVVQVVP